MIPTSRRTPRFLWQLQRRNRSAVAQTHKDRQKEKEWPSEAIEDRPELIERYLQATNRQERGKTGLPNADLLMQGQPLPGRTSLTNVKYLC
jgi:hypothetical protein